jgi:hypothetical protein
VTPKGTQETHSGIREYKRQFYEYPPPLPLSDGIQIISPIWKNKIKKLAPHSSSTTGIGNLSFIVMWFQGQNQDLIWGCTKIKNEIF